MTTLADLRKRADELRAQGWVDRKGTEMLLHDLIVKLDEDQQARLGQRDQIINHNTGMGR